MKKNIGLGMLFFANLGAMGIFYLIFATFFGFLQIPPKGGNLLIILLASLTLIQWVAFYFAAARISKGWLLFFLGWLILLLPVCFTFPLMLLVPGFYLTGVILLWNETSLIKVREKRETLVLLSAFVPTLYVTVMLTYELVIYVFDIAVLLPVALVVLSWFAIWRVSQNPTTAWGYYFTIPFLVALRGIINSFLVLGTSMFSTVSMISIVISLTLQIFGYGLVICLIWVWRKA